MCAHSSSTVAYGQVNCAFDALGTRTFLVDRYHVSMSHSLVFGVVVRSQHQ